MAEVRIVPIYDSVLDLEMDAYCPGTTSTCTSTYVQGNGLADRTKKLAEMLDIDNQVYHKCFEKHPGKKW